MVIHLLEQSPSHAVRVTAPFTQGGLWCGAAGETNLDKSRASPGDYCSPPAGRRRHLNFHSRAGMKMQIDSRTLLQKRNLFCLPRQERFLFSVEKCMVCGIMNSINKNLLVKFHSTSGLHLLTKPMVGVFSPLI